MRAHLLVLALAIVASGIALPHVAHADAAADGERLFEQGRRLMLDGHFDEACAKLEESQAVDPHLGTLLNLATCHEKLGKVGSAWVEYQKAQTAARAEGRVDRAALAKERIAAIEGRVPWLTIEAGAFGGNVTLDGAKLDTAALGTAMPVDPGEHVVVALRDDTVLFETKLKLSEGEKTTVHVTAEATKASPKEAVIVEPKPAPIPRFTLDSAPPKPTKGSWVLEIGAFAGYMGGGGARGRLVDDASVRLSPDVSSRGAETCASASCNVGTIAGGSAPTLGLMVMGGYALSESITLGLRVLAAPAIGSRGAWGFGPTVVLHPSEAFSIGLWGFFGDGSQEGNAEVSPGSADYRIVSGNPARATGTLAGGFGAGLDVSIKLFEIGRTSFWAKGTPFFIAGDSGNVFALPSGAAVRFQ